MDDLAAQFAASARGGEDGAAAAACGELPANLEPLARALRERLLERPGVDGAPTGLRGEVEALVASEAAALPARLREALVARVLVLAQGLGPLEPLLANPEVEEIMVNGHRRIWVARAGRVEPVAGAFADEDELRHLIERILAPLGRRVDEASPICDARLPDGSRVNVILPPLAIDGPCLTIRRFRGRGMSLAELVERGTLSNGAAELLAEAVRARRSVLVSGGTGAGKTTLLGALCGEIGDGERIVTIEDAAELRLRNAHVVRLEARPPNLEGRGEVTIRDLVRNALRMRPDRIVVGEVRGGEALDMLQALNTGHEGSLSTIHANSPRDALRRLETLVLMADVDLPQAAVRAQLESAVDLVVHMRRVGHGERLVSEVVALDRDGALGCRLLWRGRSAAGAVAALGPFPATEALAGPLLGSSGSSPVFAPELLAAVAVLLALASAAELLRTMHDARYAARGRLAAVLAWLARPFAAALRGHAPSRGGVAASACAGALVALPLAVAGMGGRAIALTAFATPPALAFLARLRRESRARRLDAEAAAFASALADVLAGGSSLRSALPEVGRSLRGPLRAELAAVERALERGATSDAALLALRERCGSARVEQVVAACLVQLRVGGNLPALLRRCARAFAEQDRLNGEAAAATAQARFTGLVVAVLPLGGAALSELASPGYVSALAGDPVTGPLLAVAAILQAAGLLAIRKIAHVGT